MSETKFTPGEWVVGEGDPCVYARLPSGGSVMVADCCPFQDGDESLNDADEWANARLIAAAPDLYAELKAVRKYVVRMIELCEQADIELLRQRAVEHGVRLAATDAALAKAEGGTR